MFPEDKRDFELETVDLWHDLKVLGPTATFSSWAERFLAGVARAGSKPIVVGYSLGGRLAMYAMSLAPQSFAGAVIISANTGLDTEDEKRKRLASDFQWCSRFYSDDWTKLNRDWNDQTVLAAPKKPAAESISLARSESDFDRKILAQALDIWSVARQPNLGVALKSFTAPGILLTGKEDAKYTALASNLIKDGLRSFEHRIIENAGHRVPWDAPSAVREAVSGLAAL